jgi:hypothetical protein
MRPQIKGFGTENLINQNKIGCHGFGSKFKLDLNNLGYYWLHYWYGSVCNLENLNECTHDIFSTPINMDQCTEIANYYWGNDIKKKASERIVSEFLSIL